MPDYDKVKILFRFYSDVLEEETVETMWADIVNKHKGHYKIDNIPFYAPVLACGDIVLAAFEEDEGMLTYKETVEYSGSSTIWVVMVDKSIEINTVRDEFMQMGCPSEKVSNGYFAMEVPPAVNYADIRRRLEHFEQKEILEYAEPCLADEHLAQIKTL